MNFIHTLYEMSELKTYMKTDSQKSNVVIVIYIQVHIFVNVNLSTRKLKLFNNLRVFLIPSNDPNAKHHTVGKGIILVRLGLGLGLG